jgi:acyl-CoA synthetase (AMP-forming)/AMP-acid ligase II/acyl carrier protein
MPLDRSERVALLERMRWDVATFVDVLRERARTTPNEVVYTFLLDGEDRARDMTYGELDHRARSIASAIQRVTSVGDRVILLYPDGLECVAGLAGCFYAGVVAVSGAPPLAPRSLQRFHSIVADSHASAALGPPEILVEFESMSGTTQSDLKWIADGRPSANGADSWQRPGVSNDSLALLQYTSGSTRSPRGVMLTHRNLLHNLRGQMEAFQYDFDHVGVSWLPFSHDMGLIGAVLMALYGGSRCVLMSALHFVQRPVRWLRAISNYRAALSGAPNFAYQLCVDKITPEQKRGLDLSSWRIAFNGSETIRHGAIGAFTEMFRDCGFRPQTMFPCYGLAEASLFVAGATGPSGPRSIVVDRAALAINRAVPVRSSDEQARGIRLMSCGRSLPDQDLLTVRSDERVRCAPGETGEIWIAGPSVARGYFNRPQETKEIFHAYLLSGEGPYLRTGDLGFMLDGELFVTGRLKDLIIIRGTNYYPHDLEFTAQNSHAALRGCAAFSIEGPAEEQLVLICELEHGVEDKQAEITACVRRALTEGYELFAHAVVFVRAGNIPRTPSGKIQRGLCRSLYLHNRLPICQDSLAPGESDWQSLAERWRSVAGTPPGNGDVERWFLDKVAFCGVNLNYLRPDTHLTQLGIDSLKIIQLKTEIEKEFGIRIQAADLFNAGNLSELADHILKLCRSAAAEKRTGQEAVQGAVSADPSIDRARTGVGRLRRQQALRSEDSQRACGA